LKTLRKKRTNKARIEASVAEDLAVALDKRNLKKNRSLSRALTIALGKEIPKKNKKQVFAEGFDHSPRQRISQKK
jgi:hypothetical protein